ncbi:MAG: universal stress protein [Pseudomonadota bacterium]
MKALESILVVLDKPKHEPIALDRARELQSASGAQVRLVSFCWHPVGEQTALIDGIDPNAVQEEIIAERRAWLAALELRMDGSKTTTEVVWAKDIATWVSDAVEAGRYDIVIKCVHHSETLLHTPLDWQLIRSCSAPLLIVSSEKRKRRTGNVLATLDLRRDDTDHQALNREVLEATRYFAELHGGVAHCVYAVEFSEVLRDLDVIDVRKVHDKAAAKASGELETLIAPYEIAAENIHMPDGKVGKAVRGTAFKAKTDLVVVGTGTNKRGLMAILGNSAEKILTRAPCDVLVIKL